MRQVHNEDWRTVIAAQQFTNAKVAEEAKALLKQGKGLHREGTAQRTLASEHEHIAQHKHLQATQQREREKLLETHRNRALQDGAEQEKQALALRKELQTQAEKTEFDK